MTAGARIVTGICVGFLFYVVNEILGQTSVVYGIPAIFGALIELAFHCNDLVVIKS